MLDRLRFLNETQLIKLPATDDAFSLNDENITKSCQVSSLKQSLTKFISTDMRNLTRKIINQKDSYLCAPISVTTLLRHAMEHDLAFHKKDFSHSFENILSSITLVIYPRSMAGLNLNPNRKEIKNQLTQIQLLVERICYKTYLILARQPDLSYNLSTDL